MPNGIAYLSILFELEGEMEPSLTELRLRLIEAKLARLIEAVNAIVAALRIAIEEAKR